MTKLNLQMGNMGSPEQQEAVSWLAEEEHKSKRLECKRYAWMLFFTVIAAMGACIAAWPTVREWLK